MSGILRGYEGTFDLLDSFMLTPMNLLTVSAHENVAHLGTTQAMGWTICINGCFYITAKGVRAL